MERDRFQLVRRVPESVTGLLELALDVRWTWNHEADALWEWVDAELWKRTGNAWLVLQSVPSGRLEVLCRDLTFVAEVERLVALRRAALDEPSWFARERPAPALSGVAYFSMEFALSEALPLYSGGLGVLAGDVLKTASDLGLPMVGVGLLYQTGYFRQQIDASGAQVALHPYNNPMLLPVLPVLGSGGEWKCVSLELPGRELRLRCWQVIVGRVVLYLLDSNDPLNTPGDRTITGELYTDAPEARLQQEIVLGIGGFRMLELLGVRADVLHLNEGHAAFAVLERARTFMHKRGVPFAIALAATRAGTLFTTHTSVADAFDRFAPELLARYFEGYAAQLGIELTELLALGRLDPHARDEPFAMPLLAMRGAGHVNGVSRLHGEVSRGIFQPLFARWPRSEVPISHVTNGVHAPSWDSQEADSVWEEACGRPRWRGDLEALECGFRKVSDETLWSMRNRARRRLVAFVRERAARQRAFRSAHDYELNDCAHLFDPDVLTLGFARRFAAYKRPNLLLRDSARLMRLLSSASRPVQLVLAGKAHPNDPHGTRLLHAWYDFVDAAGAQARVAFIEDYDLTVAQELVQGVDVWINTPRRPWEACGTSGMKILVNGGLNLSVLDGWWAEHYAPEVGFAVGVAHDQMTEPSSEAHDAADALDLHRVLEEQVVPEFYKRDARGVPVAWVARLRESMARLAPACSANRMLREYVRAHYAPLATELAARDEADLQIARQLVQLQKRLDTDFRQVRFGELTVSTQGDLHVFDVQVYLNGFSADELSVELFVHSTQGGVPVVVPMERGARLSGLAEAYAYWARVPADRPREHYTPRIIPRHPHAVVPLELSAIHWQR